MFSIFKTIDSKLMIIFTYNWRHRDRSKISVTYALKSFFLFLFVAAVYGTISITSDAGDRAIPVFIAGLCAATGFYHWRLWRKLRAERAGIRKEV